MTGARIARQCESIAINLPSISPLCSMNPPNHTQSENAHRIEWLRTMVTIRRFEERAEQLYKAGFIRGGSHSSVGEEASAVGVCAALAPNDWLVTTYRGTGHCIAKGMPLTSIMAEF